MTLNFGLGVKAPILKRGLCDRSPFSPSCLTLALLLTYIFLGKSFKRGPLPRPLKSSCVFRTEHVEAVEISQSLLPLFPDVSGVVFDTHSKMVMSQGGTFEKMKEKVQTAFLLFVCLNGLFWSLLCSLCQCFYVSLSESCSQLNECFVR